MKSSPRITVLDALPLNPGDLSWSGLERLGRMTVHERTRSEQRAEHARDAEVLLTNKVVLDAELIGALPALRHIAVMATGTNVVDLEAARARGVSVSNVPAYSTESVAQLVFAFLLDHASRVASHSPGVHSGEWSRRDWCYWNEPLLELDGMTFGIIGLGVIGRSVARKAAAFGMKVIAHTRTAPADPPAGVEFVSLERVFRESDVLSLHLPLTDASRHLVNAERLGWMKPSAFVINTGRGPLVDEVALASALREGRIAGAGIDVLSSEPPPPDHPLFGAPNCRITPHIGWATPAARSRLIRELERNVEAFLAGAARNIVNGVKPA